MSLRLSGVIFISTWLNSLKISINTGNADYKGYFNHIWVLTHLQTKISCTYASKLESGSSAMSQVEEIELISFEISNSMSSRRRRTRTVQLRTALYRPYPAGQTDIGQHFYTIPDRIRKAGRIETDRIRTENPDRIQTPNRHWTWFSGQVGQKRDKDRTRTVLSADVWCRVLPPVDFRHWICYQLEFDCEYLNPHDPWGQKDEFRTNHW